MPYTENKEKFKPAQMVVLKSDSSKRGPVISVRSGSPQDVIEVFIDDKVQPFYASQIEAYKEKAPLIFSSDRFRAYLSALEILHPGMSSLYSINAARVDFIPYQYRPVLRFIRATARLLLMPVRGAPQHSVFISQSALLAPVTSIRSSKI